MENRSTEDEVIVISDDESSIGQPSEKNSRREETPVILPPLPNAEVVDLQKKVVRLKAMYQRAVHAATVSETARLAAKNLIDSKRLDNKKELENELQKRLAELSTQLDEARRRVEEATVREMNAARESDEAKLAMIGLKGMLETAEKEKEQLVKDKCTLEQELEEKRKEHSISPNDELVFANFALTTELDASRKKAEDASIMNDELSRENSALRDQLIEARREAEIANKLRSENSELKEQLDNAMRSERLVKINENKLSIEIPVVKRELDRVRGTPDGAERRKRMLSAIDQHIGREPGPAPKRGPDPASIDADCESNNIFQLVRPGARDTISLNDAIGQIRSKFYECGHTKWTVYCRRSRIYTHECEICSKSMHMRDVFHHFVSHGHVVKVRANDAAVSQSAVEHWLNQLQLAMDADAAAGAADAAVGRSAELLGDSVMQEHVQADD